MLVSIDTLFTDNDVGRLEEILLDIDTYNTISFVFIRIF